jgi:hypothetical protein
MFGTKMPSSRFRIFGSGSRFPARTVTLTNSVSNGNFINTTGWTTGNGTASASNNTYVLTGSGANAEVYSYQTIPAAIIGRKYYIKFLARVTNEKCLHISCTRGGVYSDVQLLPSANTWYLLSTIVTATSTSAPFVIAQHYASAAIANGAVLEIQYVLVSILTNINRTESAPVLDQVDDCMVRFPNKWFSGSQTITI